MGEYFRNMETNKLELHFTREEYMALSNDQKTEVRSNFLFSKRSGAWVSRCKFPNLYRAEQVAIKLGLENTGSQGEKISFAEQQERKAERAERRAERMDKRAETAMKRGEDLQKPINDMHGDIAFFTQPNINTSAGRAFTNRRNRMWSAWERGFEEFKKSEYYTERAEKARKTMETAKNPHDKAFCQRRIEEAEASIRKVRRNMEEYEGYKKQIEAGEKPHNKYGWEVKVSIESINRELDRWNEMLDDYIDKVVYYREVIESLGGIGFTKENLHKGDLVRINRYRGCIVRIIRFGQKNVTFEFTEGNMKLANGAFMQGKCAYAEIAEVVKSA